MYRMERIHLKNEKYETAAHKHKQRKEQTVRTANAILL